MFYVVCKAGFYKNGTLCVMCPDNKIKSSSGNTTNCDDNTACDGKYSVPNSEHNACGKFLKCTIGPIYLSLSVLATAKFFISD